MLHHALGVDLASASWADNGSALVSFDRDSARFVSVSPGAIAWPSSPLTARSLADAVDAFAREHGVGAVALDGPQGWRAPETAPELPGVGRRSEYRCRTQGKTGVYPQTYPRTQRAWIELCIEVFDALLEKPGVVLAEERGASAPASGYLLLECFPTSSWRASGLTPLPGKRKRPALAPFVSALSRAFALPAFSTSSHDDLQAVVCALVAAAAIGGPADAIVHGDRSRSVVHGDGRSRRVEGVIWGARPLGPPSPLVGDTFTRRRARRAGARARA